MPTNTNLRGILVYRHQYKGHPTPNDHQCRGHPLPDDINAGDILLSLTPIKEHSTPTYTNVGDVLGPLIINVGVILCLLTSAMGILLPLATMQ